MLGYFYISHLTGNNNGTFTLVFHLVPIFNNLASSALMSGYHLVIITATVSMTPTAKTYFPDVCGHFLSVVNVLMVDVV